jgi:hypothetical protein
VHPILPLLIGRRGILGVVLIALALWTQALAPAAALRMLAAMSDPLRNPILCGPAVDGGEEVRSNVGVPAPAHPECALCQLCCAGVALPTLPSGPAAIRSVHWHPVSWPIPPPTRARPPSRCLGQPRAPPHLV